MLSQRSVIYFNRLRKHFDKRILIHWIKEHDNEAKDSAIQTHRKEFPTHTINPYNIEIIVQADTNYKVELKEALHINTKKTELNIQHAAAYKRKNKKDLFKSTHSHHRPTYLANKQTQ